MKFIPLNGLNFNGIVESLFSFLLILFEFYINHINNNVVMSLWCITENGFPKKSILISREGFSRRIAQIFAELIRPTRTAFKKLCPRV